jgi:hypothetical protein
MCVVAVITLRLTKSEAELLRRIAVALAELNGEDLNDEDRLWTKVLDAIPLPTKGRK